MTGQRNRVKISLNNPNAFAARYQFVDRENGKVIYETDLRTTGHFDQDTVEYAMERNAEAAAKVITKFKGR